MTAFFGRADILYLDADLARTFPLPELTWVVAHEMRHSKSMWTMLLLLQKSQRWGITAAVYGQCLLAGAGLLGGHHAVMSLAVFWVWTLVAPFRCTLMAIVGQWNEYLTDTLAACDLGECRSAQEALRLLEENNPDHRLVEPGWRSRFYATHPPIAARVERLAALEVRS